MANAKLELFNSYFKELSSDEKELHKKRNERAKEIGLILVSTWTLSGVI